MGAASFGCWAAARMSLGAAARLCMRQRLRTPCSTTLTYWQRL